MHIIPLFILMLIFLLNGISSSSFSSFNISAFIDLNLIHLRPISICLFYLIDLKIWRKGVTQYRSFI